MAILYAIGLSIVGLPLAIVVGAGAGLLNVVPYLGIAIGITLATIITAVSEPSLIQFIKIYSVFGIVQMLEGFFLTPKIVGDSVGIHPFGVMLALIVGGQLFGLLGLVLAVPTAASTRVLFHHMLAVIDDKLD